MFLRSSSWLSHAKRALLVGTAAALTACGGEIYDGFEPERILSVGDEYSYIDAATGAKYTINRINNDNSFNCSEYPLWNQIVAAEYGFRFQQCTPAGGTADTRGQLLARQNAKAADLQTQIDDFGGLREDDLVLVQVGANDVWELFERYENGETIASLQAEATTRGTALASRLNGWTSVGARILVLDVFNQGSTPEAGASAVADARAQLRALTDAFNDGLRKGVNEAANRHIAFMRANDRLQSAVDDDQYNFDDRASAACTVSPATTCTTSTLKPSVDPNPDERNYIFAADRYLTPAMNRIVGDVAASLVDDFPF